MIVMILCFISIIGFIVAAVAFPEEDWSVWGGCICVVVAISCIFFGIAQGEKKPIRVHTKQQPQIDTIIEIRNKIPDTTYVYIFTKTKEEAINDNRRDNSVRTSTDNNSNSDMYRR